ncbi:MAG: DUF3276 family protein [Chitinophagaceae bacterium]|nr:DUF3276 family protein [Chitinophagaceae bacterium]
MAYENHDKKMESIFSKKIRAGKRRTYFFDVRTTRGNDYYLTITESRKRFDDNGYDRHKIFLYKEDFNKFSKALEESVDYVKTELMPDFDFDAFNHDENENQFQNNGDAANGTTTPAAPKAEAVTNEETMEKNENVDATSEAPPNETSDVSSSGNTEEAEKW